MVLLMEDYFESDIAVEYDDFTVEGGMWVVVYLMLAPIFLGVFGLVVWGVFT